MAAKTKNKSKVLFDPLADFAVDQLMDDMESDFKDACKTMDNDTHDVVFDMFNPDSWDLMVYALDDIRNYINFIREELVKEKNGNESGKRGVQYWMNKHNTLQESHGKEVGFWKRRFEKEAALNANNT